MFQSFENWKIEYCFGFRYSDFEFEGMTRRIIVKKHSQRLVIALILATVWCILPSMQAAELYYTNRTFTAVEFGNLIRPADMVNAESKKLTNIVKGAAVKLDPTNTYAIEKQAAIAIGYDFPEDAWDAVVAYAGTPSNYPGKIFDNVGWVRGTKSVNGDWGAYLWTLRNRIAFRSSETNWWVSPSNGVRVVISNVLVGSLGNYGPVSNVVDIGPRIPTNYPWANHVGTYQVDITNVYYELVIPDIWITPRFAVTCIGGSNVQYTVTGTNIPQGVTWKIIPSGVGATIQTNSDWYHAEVTPGDIATIYKVRAISVDNPNFYDEVRLTVVRVVIDDYTTVTYDGWDSENLICRVEPEGVTPSSYTWSATWYTPAYNNPQVTFENPYSKSTRILNAHWYARTTNSYESDLALYIIHSTVQINGMSCSNFYTETFYVGVYSRGGWCERPRLMPTIIYDWVEVNGYYMVTGVAELSRINAQIHINYTTNSQFYLKTQKHEQQHKDDYDNGFDGRVFFDENEFASMIIGLTNATLSGLNVMVDEKYAEYESAEDAEIDSVLNTLEERAYAVSDAERPFYVYQGGGL